MQEKLQFLQQGEKAKNRLVSQEEDAKFQRHNAVNCADIKQLRLELPAADIAIVGNNSQKALLEVEWAHGEHHGKAPPTLCLVAKGQTLSLYDDKHERYIGKEPIKIRLSVPKDLHLAIKLAIGGNLYLDNLSGNLDVSLPAGKIDGKITSKNTTIDMATGDINLSQLQGSAKIHNKVGNINVAFDFIRRKDKVDIKTKIGNMSIQFPFQFLSNNQVAKCGKVANTADADVRVECSMGKLKWSTASKPRPVDTLPIKVLTNIFGFLNAKELVRAERVCKSWHAVANTESLWKNLYLKRFSAPHEGLASLNWKQKYEQTKTGSWPKSDRSKATTYFFDYQMLAASQIPPTYPIAAYFPASTQCTIS